MELLVKNGLVITMDGARRVLRNASVAVDEGRIVEIGRGWLREEIWPVEAKLEGRHIYAGALLGCLEMIRSGTTCFNDMYFFMDEVARAVEESGIRGVL